MPRVTPYGGPRVQQNAMPGVRRQAAETFESLGGGVGQAQARLAEVGINAATQVFGRMEAQRRQQADAARRRADQLAVLEADNKLASWENTALFDPQKGALNTKGKAAAGLPETVGQAYDKAAGEIESTLSTIEQRDAFARARLQRRQSIDERLMVHVAREIHEYDQQETEKGVTNSVNAAIQNAGDPARVAFELQRQTATIKDYAAANGMGPEETQARIAQAQTATHAGVIEQLLALGEDRKATEYFKVAKEQITGDALPKVERALEVASTEGDALRAATDLWTKLGPKTDDDAINLDVMEESARQQFADDPKRLKATIQFIRERKEGVTASRKEREDASAGALWEAAANGATLTSIRRMPGYLNATGRVQAQISDYIVGRAERNANRAAAEESRAWTRQQRGDAMKEKAGWAKFWDYAQPDRLAQMSDAQLNALRGDLGDDHVNRLFDMKRKPKTAEDLKAATIDAQQFKSLAQSAGFNAYDPSDDDKAALGELQNAVETEIDAEQRARGNKALNRDEKQAVMQRVIDRKVMIDRSFRSDTERTAAVVVNASDRASAYVPVQQIPKRSVSEAVNYLRSLSPANQRLSDEAIAAKYQRQIERAYAANRLKLGMDEELKRLRGGE